MLLRALAACAALTCLAATPAPAAPVQQRLDELVAAGVPGAVVLVRDGSDVTVRAAGTSDLATGRPMRVDDRFRIASLTKTFAATVVMQLVDEGRLSLDDPVERWLPGVVPNGENITVRQLLGHQSGLFDFQDDPSVLAPYLAGDLDHYWSPLGLLGVATAHPPLFAPGAGVSYSATGYVALGLVVEAVTGHSMTREVRTRLFRPLGLRSTTFPDRGLIRTRHAHGYLIQPGQPLWDVTDVSPSYYWTTGNIVSTATDVARFYDALFAGRLVSPARLAEMETTRPDERGVQWGLGLFHGRLRCGDYYGHDGASPGFLSVAYESPDGSHAVVALINTMTFEETPGDAAAQAAWRGLVEDAFCG
jgi:D-alanyl-D-alanine carboxypeptidase